MFTGQLLNYIFTNIKSCFSIFGTDTIKTTPSWKLSLRANYSFWTLAPYTFAKNQYIAYNLVIYTNLIFKGHCQMSNCGKNSLNS